MSGNRGFCFNFCFLVLTQPVGPDWHLDMLESFLIHLYMHDLELIRWQISRETCQIVLACPRQHLDRALAKSTLSANQSVHNKVSHRVGMAFRWWDAPAAPEKVC